MSGIDGLLQVDVGGSQHPNVDRGAFARTQPHNLLFLQDAQQFGLQFQRNLADLVEKNRPAVRQFKATQLLRNRACKGAPLMAEQFAL